MENVEVGAEVCVWFLYSALSNCEKTSVVCRRKPTSHDVFLKGLGRILLRYLAVAALVLHIILNCSIWSVVLTGVKCLGPISGEDTDCRTESKALCLELATVFPLVMHYPQSLLFTSHTVPLAQNNTDMRAPTYFHTQTVQLYRSNATHGHVLRNLLMATVKAEHTFIGFMHFKFYLSHTQVQWITCKLYPTVQYSLLKYDN